MGSASARLFWSSPVRLAAFWGLTLGLTLILQAFTAQVSIVQALAIIGEAVSGNVERMASRDFAFTLAALIVDIAAALAISFFLLHAVLVSATIGAAQRRVASASLANGGPGFLAARRMLRSELGAHPIIGDAWRTFDDTLVMPDFADEPLRFSTRAASVLNVSVARDRLAGLKMMPSIPGYFVGIGLLLTFFGLVLALNEAAAGTTSNEIGAMRVATARLLQVATFKFATSIAGLGASIVLSILFRAYTIMIEGAFEKLCRTVERELIFASPQAATIEMNRTLSAQLRELRSLNGPGFGGNLAEALAPALQLALNDAMQPLSAALKETVARLDDASRSGVEEMLKRFLEGVRGGAGTEMRELGENLRTLQATLDRTQQSLSGSGLDFSQRMAETANQLNDLIVRAGSAIGVSAETSSAKLNEMVSAMHALFERANGRIEADLANAAGGASARLEAAMGAVFTRLEAQIAQMQSGLGGFQAGMAEQLEESRQRTIVAQESTLTMVDQAAAAAASVLKNGFASVIESINTEVDRMIQSMRVAEMAMVAQAGAVKDATTQSRAVAEAFGATAQLVRTASEPLIQSGDRVVGATNRMAESMTQTVTAFSESQQAARTLADNLTHHVDRLTEIWSGYESRFGAVDADLGMALVRLSEETRRQLDILAMHTVAIDKGLALAVDKLSGHVAGIAEGAGDLAESVELLRTSLVARAAE
jgi:hypothetical protein